MSRRVAILVLLPALLLLSVGAWFLWRPGPPPNRPDEDGIDRREQRSVARRALALLENGRPEEAIPILEGIRRAVPDDTFAVRNLVVAHLERLVNLPPRDPARAVVLDEAEKAVADLLDREPTADSHVLAGRLAVERGDDAAAERHYDRSFALDERNAATWYEFWNRFALSDDEALRARAESALERAIEFDPNNVFVQLDMVRLRTDQQDPKLTANLDRLEHLLGPFAEGIERRTTADVGELARDAAAAVQEDDWAKARRSARFLVNVTRPSEVSQSDRLRVERHPLEFVRRDFGPDFYAEPGWKPSVPPAAKDVTFVAVPVAELDRFAEPRSVLVRDVDLDGRPDLVVLAANKLSTWLASDAGFVPGPAADLPGSFTGVLAADLDADVDPALTRLPMEGETIEEVCVVADLDFVVWGPAGVVLVANVGDEGGRRSLRTLPAADVLEVEPGTLNRPTTVVRAADVDHDGDLDLLLGHETGLVVLANRGRFLFEDVSDRTAMPEDAGEVTAFLPVDLDQDVDLDLVVIRRGAASGWLENLRHGSLRWRAVASLGTGSAAWLADTADSRGWELDVAGGDGVSTTTARDDVPGSVTWSEPRSLVEDDVAGGLVFDFDNDGVLDRLLWGEFGTRVLGGGVDGAFTDVDDALAVDGTVVGCDVGDLDGDGDLDVVVLGAEGGVTSFRNEGGDENEWLRIALKAQQVKGAEVVASGRVNQHGIGSLVELRAGDVVRRHVVDRPWTHLGLADRDRADMVRVTWTNGIPFNVIGPKSRLAVCEKQSLKGSCPYLYAWDGEKFAFVTDLLWAAPVGLQFADGVIAQPREWEHLLVPGRFVAERDGEYELRITEELWEVAYLDHVELVAVDHPADCEVFTNEKVGPPSIAEHRLRTVTRARTPVAVSDGRGRDLLPAVRERDERYGRTFERRLRQGLAEEHVLEIDLGLAADERPERLTLYLAGWVFPSDTSLNVALSNDPSLPSPTPPRLDVPDGEGGWRTAIPFTGFPGGKTKTIAIDLGGLVPTDDPRVRLVTNMEFAWDHVFFTVDEPDRTNDLRSTPLSLVAAELGYRGFSREDVDEGFGPHRYDYADVSTEPKWPPIAGGFTRYGDVRTLIGEEDDRLVVMGSGDEMRLRFRVPAESPPEGWVRDFVIRNVGWDKDADLNTVYGSTVEPLPLRGTTAYPPERTPEQSALLRADTEAYHWRRQSAARFRHRLRDPSDAFSSPARP